MLTHLRAAAEVWVERGKAAQGLQQVLKKESITYLWAALSTHTHEEEAPWLCRTPAVDATGAQMPFICHQLLWVLDNYPFILRLALGLLGATFGNAWDILPFSSVTHSPSLTDHIRYRRLTPFLKKGTLWYNSHSGAPRGIRLRLDFSWIHTLVRFFPFCLISFSLSWVERGPSVILVSKPSQALLRKTISCVYSQLLYCMALRKNHGARRNGRERVVSGNNLIKAFLSSIPLFSVRRPLI